MEYTTVISGPVTKGSKLVKELRDREKEINKFSKERIKFVEDADITLKSLLVQNDPFPKSKCEKKNCLICESETSGNIKFECNFNIVGYRLGCDTCAFRGLIRIYEGETFRSARTRGAEHLADLKNERPSGVIFKHKENAHKTKKRKKEWILLRNSGTP